MVDFADAVAFVAASSGTGSFVSSSSVSSFLTPAQGFTLNLLIDGATYPYFAVDSPSSPTQREWGTATYTQSTGTFTRNVFGGISSGTATGPGTKVNFSTAPTVTLTLLAEYMTDADFTASTASTTVTISIASPAVITWTAHGFVPNQVVQFTTTGSLPTGISASTNYYVLAAGLTANAFEISASPGGAAINTSGSQSGTQTGTGQTLVIPYPSITIGPSGLTGSQTTSLLSLAQTWNTTGTADAVLKVNVTNIASHSGSLLADFQVGGTTSLYIQAVGQYTASAARFALGSPGGIPGTIDLSNNSGGTLVFSGVTSIHDVIAANSYRLGFNTVNGDFTDFAACFLLDGANNIIAQANPTHLTTAQGFRIYNTADAVPSPTNFERGVFDWTTTANTLTVGTQKGGTGSARGVQFVYGGTNYFDLGIALGAGWINFSEQVNFATNMVLSSGNFTIGNVELFEDVSHVLGIGLTASSRGIHVYNTNIDLAANPTNYERGLFDWTATANTLTIGAQAGGSGVLRAVEFVGKDFVFGTAALSTSATDGFVYIPTSAGVPTGTPTSFTGTVAMEYDTTDNRLYVYNSGWQNVSSGGGGGVSGSGTSGQVAYWSSSTAITGDAGMTYTAAGQLTLALGTITANAKALNITGTFNNSATTFDAPLFMNITNTASHSGSLLIDIQASTFSAFQVDASVTGFGSSGGLRVSTDGNGGTLFGINGNISISAAGTTTSPKLHWLAGDGIVIGDGTTITTKARLDIDGASNTVAFKNSTSATALRVYNTTDTNFGAPTNYERGVFDWTSSANTLTIGTQKGGTGSARNVSFVAPGGTYNQQFTFSAPGSNSGGIIAFTCGTGTSVNVPGITGSGNVALILGSSGGASTVAFGGYGQFDSNWLISNTSYLALTTNIGLAWGTFTNGGPPTSTNDTGFYRSSAAVIGIGNGTVGDVASPVAMGLKLQSAAAGNVNIAGGAFTETASLSTGGGAQGLWNIATGFTGVGAAGTATISDASPAVITEASHNYFVGMPFTLTTTGTLPTGFSIATTYYIISAGFGSGAFEASTSFGGSAVNTSSAGSGTHTVNPGGVCTISNASPAVITLNNHGLVPGMVVQFATTGSLPTGLSTATNYFVISAGLTVNAFEVSTTLNGSAVNTSSAGSGTQTVLYQGGTVQNPAYTVATWGPSQLIGQLTTPALQINQVWNTSGTVDAAFKMNVTNVASHTGSLVADFQVNGTTIFGFYNTAPAGSLLTGNVLGFANAAGNGIMNISSGTGWGLISSYWGYTDGSNWQINLSGGIMVAENRYIGFANSSSANASAGSDTTLFRDATAGILAFSSNTSPTTGVGFRVYNTTDNVATNLSPTNYERGVFDWTTTANTLTIGTQKGGTGSTRNLEFVVGGTNELDFGITNASVWTSAAPIIAANFAPISSSAASGNISPTPDTTGMYIRSALSAACTISAPTGTFFDGQKLEFRLKDNGTSQTLTWTTSSGGFRAINVTLPTATTASKNTYVGAIWNSADSFWDVVAVQTG